MSFSAFHSMGGTLFMSILSLSLLAIIVMTILNIIRIAGNRYDPALQKFTVGDIKAVGIFAIVWGIFGQSIGLFTALQILESAPDVSPAMIYGGIKVSFITTLYGTFIFLLAWLITLIINNWSRRK